RWSRAVDGAGLRIRRHVDCEHPQKFPIGVEYLNAPVGAIADVEIVVAIGHDRMGQTKLPRLRALVAPGFHPVPVLIVLGYARVDVAVGDVYVPLRVPRDVGGLTE